MNNNHKEHLSALIDNEIGPDALSDLEVNDSLLHRYQLIGDAIKGNLCDASLIDVSAQVRLAIESENAHSAAPVKAESVKTTQQVSSASHWFDFSAWLRPAGGMAVAASVAVVMVMVFNQPESNDIGINGLGSQVAIDTRPVLSLPVNNVNHSVSDALKAVNSKAIDNKDKDDLKKSLENLKNKPAPINSLDNAGQ